MAKRRRLINQFKAKMVLEALWSDRLIKEIAALHQLHPNEVSTWKCQAVEGLAVLFTGDGAKPGHTEADINELQPKVGRSSVESVFLSQGLNR